MANYTPTQIKDRFNVKMRDSEDRTFTSAEKDEFYQTALADQYVYRLYRDTSLTTIANQATYDVSALGFTDEVQDFGYDVNADGHPYFLDRAHWEVIGGTLTLDRFERPPAGKTIHIIGKKKYTTADTEIPDYLVEYILELMSIEAFETLKSGLTTRFLKNDITMSEIIASLETHRRRAAEIRATLPNRRPVQG